MLDERKYLQPPYSLLMNVQFHSSNFSYLVIIVNLLEKQSSIFTLAMVTFGTATLSPKSCCLGVLILIVLLLSYFSFGFLFRVGWFLTAINSFRGYMGQIVFDSSCSLRIATFLRNYIRHSIFLRVVYLFHHSNYSHPSFEVGYLFLSQKE